MYGSDDGFIQHPRTLRLIDTPQGVCTAFYDTPTNKSKMMQRFAGLLGPLVVFFGFIALSGAFPGWKLLMPWVLGLYLLVTLGFVVSSIHHDFIRLLLGEDAITIGRMRRRAATHPSVDVVRKGESSPYLFQGLPPRVLPYDAIESLGHTEYSLWFALSDGTREEVMMEHIEQSEIKRLADEVFARWRQHHQQKAESVSTARQRALQPQ